MPGPTQDDRKKDQTPGPSTGTMDSDKPPPPPNPLDGESMPSGTYREDFYKEQAKIKEQTRDQQAMTAEMNKGRGQSDEGQARQQSQDNSQRR